MVEKKDSNPLEEQILEAAARQSVKADLRTVMDYKTHELTTHGHLIERGTDVTMIQKLLGHNDIKTTLRYLHTSNKDLLKIISPLDDLDLG